VRFAFHGFGSKAIAALFQCQVLENQKFVR
jgi:hypothetical protein